MKNTEEFQLQSERQVLYFFLLMRSALREYHTWGERACASRELRSDPQFALAIEKIVQVVDTCAKYFQEVQPSSNAAAEAFTSLRKMGLSLKEYSDCLSALMQPVEQEGVEWYVAETKTLSRSIQEHYRQFFQNYETIYPGRFDYALDTLRQGTFTPC